MNYRRAVIASCAIAVILLSGCAAIVPTSSEHGFVRVEGTHFIVDGHPLYYCGANLWYGMYLGSPGSTGDRPRLLRELDSLKARGIVNLRILGASEASPVSGSVKPPVQVSAGVYD